MIISASRRTDIPALYSEWFMNRIRAGYCTVPNPFNRRQVARVSLHPEDVEAIVFWTRNPRPLFPRLEELGQRGHHYYFQFTVMDNPREIDTSTPPLTVSTRTFVDLAKLIGPEKIVWRYDPIVFSKLTGSEFHLAKYRQIARELKGSTVRSVISIMDVYRKANGRLRQLAEQGIEIVNYGGQPNQRFADLMTAIAQIATDNRMDISSCAETIDLTAYGIRPGKCIDNEIVDELFHIDSASKKDPTQRKACGCVISKDIGMYDSCVFGCQYCYATTGFERARVNHETHDPKSPSLLGWYDMESTNSAHQMGLPLEER